MPRMRRECLPTTAAAILLVCCVMFVTVPFTAGQRWIWDSEAPDDRRSPPDRQRGPQNGFPFGPPEGLMNPDPRYPSPDNWPFALPPTPPPSRPRRPQRTRRPTTEATTPTTTTLNPARLVNVQGAPVNCTCPATSEFNPVCGTNGATYNSPVKLRCAQRCGYDVDMAHYGRCPTTPAPTK